MGREGSGSVEVGRGPGAEVRGSGPSWDTERQGWETERGTAAITKWETETRIGPMEGSEQRPSLQRIWKYKQMGI